MGWWEGCWWMLALRKRRNLWTSVSKKQVENLLRKRHVTPATVAIIRGVPKVGLSDDDLELLGKEGAKVRKCSRRDIARCIADKAMGATTVSGTMLLAQSVGLRVFVTGGIGGVHRGAETTWDASADLMELAKTPMAVVCAGAKSILDVGKTLEVLETHGVPVVSVRQEEFPAFFTAKGQHKAPIREDNFEKIAAIAVEHWRLGGGGMVVGVPNDGLGDGRSPSSSSSFSGVGRSLDSESLAAQIERATSQATREVNEKVAKGELAGRDVTPYVLARVNELTKGRSLAANMELVRNNAKFAAELTKSICAHPSSASLALPSGLRLHGDGSSGDPFGSGAGGSRACFQARTTVSPHSCASTAWRKPTRTLPLPQRLPTKQLQIQHKQTSQYLAPLLPTSSQRYPALRAIKCPAESKLDSAVSPATSPRDAEHSQ